MKSKILVVTGGTGSFGNAVVKRFISDFKEIRIFSRDEKKQDDMRRLYNSNKLRFYLGDVRNLDSVKKVMKGADYVFHAAALKQVPSCEFFPLEAVRTNILGTQNVLDAAIESKVSKVICLSTDKAAYPINAMGISKAMMEKIARAASLNSGSTTIALTRYGNVMGSRGSVIPLFKNQIEEGKNLTVTDPFMTRYFMSLDDAVDLVQFAFDNANNGDLFVQKAPAATIQTLANALINYYESKSEVVTIGTRHGEKKWETLCTKEELILAEDLGDFYRIPMDGRDLNYEKYFTQGGQDLPAEDYNSNNAFQLNENQLIEKIKKSGLI